MTESRPILPQGFPSYTSDHVWNGTEQAGPKNYVFVDEHNRQRRLKVMRACEACRRRKIKCDAVTTNKWPCQRCQKSSLDCIPPPSDGGGYEYEFDAVGNGISPIQQQQQHSNDHQYQMQQPAAEYPNMYQDGYFFHPQQHSNAAAPQHIPSPSSSFDVHSVQHATSVNGQVDRFTSSPTHDLSSSRIKGRVGSADAASDGWPRRQDTPSDADLAEALGDLQINFDSVAPYMANQKSLAHMPAVEEAEIVLPPSGHTPGTGTVAIPESMMPSNEKANRYFNFYFDNIHPYVPVLYAPTLRKQWAANRLSISPLILEGIFACSSHMLGETEECARWLALAGRHQESFKDTPRLSTIQGLIIILKAREVLPQRGYYYRSWMTVVLLIAMAKDLDFQNHKELHECGKDCGSSHIECALKTRIWHTLYQLEVMIGGPQGRSDFAIPTDTVDFDAPQNLNANLDDKELQIFRDQTQIIRCVCNIRESNRLYYKLRNRNDDWCVSPEFLGVEVRYDEWLQELPIRYQIDFPTDGSPPYLTFHDVGNLLSYYWLTIVMHHRAKLTYASKAEKPQMIQNEMRICYNAATRLCRLNEAILSQFGLSGLAAMQRGISLTIYTVLTCTLLHLAAMTSPDPEVNRDAQTYFVRHMRVLERCAESWPMPEVRSQVDSVRQAFSADTSKPFELKPHFPYGSPRKSPTPSTPSDGGSLAYDPSQYSSGQRTDISSTTAATSISMPQPQFDGTARAASIGSESMYGSVTLDQSGHLSPFAQETTPFTWNPSKLMNSWDAAFNQPPPPPPPPQNMPMQGSASNHQLPQQQASMYVNNGVQQNFANGSSDFDFQAYNNAAPYNGTNYSQSFDAQASEMAQAFANQAPSQPQNMYQAQTASANFLTPNMWQETVASTYGHGLKRRYHADSAYGSAKKTR